MAEKKEPVETTEDKYERAKRLEESTRSLLRDKERGQIFQKAADLYASLGDYEDAEKRAEACGKQAKEFQDKYKQQVKEEKAKQKQEKQEESNETKILVRKIVFGILAVLVVLALVAAIFSKTKPGRYYRASLCEKVGAYEKSYKMFNNLKDYKDSEKRYQESCYKYADECFKKHKLTQAKNAFRKLADYKDSELKLTDVELQNIREQKIGAEVLFGEYRWLILEKSKDKVFLVKSLPINGFAFDEGDANNWFDSTIRRYLNGTFFDETFNQYQQKQILSSVVDEQTGTKDQLFMLTAEQANHYHDILSNYLRDWWLMDEGKNPHTAQFVSQGVVMDYGYDMSTTTIFIRPGMWISLK